MRFKCSLFWLFICAAHFLAAPAFAEDPATREEAPDSLIDAGSPQQDNAVRVVRLCAVGDNLIHSSVYNKFRNKDGTWDFRPIYSRVGTVLKSHDISVINQETIFVNDNKRVSTYPCFGTPQEMGDALVSAGFNVVLAATNHTWDKRSYGVDTTLAY